MLFLLPAAWVLAAATSHAATAYEALQVLKQTRGDAILGQLVEVRGDSGQPQPQAWKILMADPQARAGLREFIVTGKEITSERTPLRSSLAPASLRPLNFTRLNLDSDGAFRIANDQAAKQRVGFNRVDYLLQTNATSGAPEWSLRLFDHMGAPVGDLLLSAENGAVVSALRMDPDARVKPPAPVPTPAPAPVAAPRAPAATPAPTVPPVRADQKEEITTYFPGGIFGFTERTAKKVGRTVTRATLNTAGFVQEIFTGERTIGEPEKTGSE